MIVRREKIRKEIHRASMDIFYKKNNILLNEDPSNYNQSIFNHRTTKFNNFSESYRTNKNFQEETGVKVAMLDESIENDDLLSCSYAEMFNPEDLSRKEQKSFTTKNKSNVETVEKNSERNIFSLFNSKSCNEKDHKLLAKKSSRNGGLDSLEKRKTLWLNEVNIEKQIPIKSNSEEQIVDEKNVFDKINKLIDPGMSLNGSYEANDTSLKNDCCKKSSLAKRGKKRFRNLHDTREQRNNRISKTRSKMRFFYPNYPCLSEESNSPHTGKNIVSIPNAQSTPKKFVKSVTKLKTLTSSNNIESSLNNKISIFIDNAKRRRLNSVSSVKEGDLDDLCDINPADFIRITRSRVASCS